MKERRKRLQKSLWDKPQEQFEENYLSESQKRQIIIQGFSVSQLEDMLRTSTKNVAHEVVSCLIPSRNNGVLTNIIKFLSSGEKSSVQKFDHSMLEHVF